MDGSNYGGTLRDGSGKVPSPRGWSRRLRAARGPLLMLAIVAITLALLVLLQPALPAVEGQ